MTDKLNDILEHCEQALSTGDVKALRQVSLDLSLLQAHSPGDVARLGCFRIDVGAALRDITLVELGLNSLEKNWERLEPIFGASQLHYNIGNGHKSVHDIARAEAAWIYCPANLGSLYSAKRHYWQAYSGQSSDPEWITNLANTLNASGRVVDALHYFDECIVRFPHFGMAHVNRALALQYLNTASGGYSIKLLYEIRTSALVAVHSPSTEPSARQGAARLLAQVTNVLMERGLDPEEDSHDRDETESEYAAHDSYWQWCLQQDLTLSEHSLYCRCQGARRDDLSVLSPGSPLVGAKVPLMELMLNRMKSEYALARSFHYQSAPEAETSPLQWDLKAFEATFTDLLDGESTGVKTELLRTGFRLCFGILDRIARAICDFLGIADEAEDLYFHRFWRPRGKASTRWEDLNSQNSANLTALYGLAVDLNEKAAGQWSHLKAYRDLFEHEFCVVRTTDDFVPPEWFVQQQMPSITSEQLRLHALDMLRFTRSALFYFSFFVREKSQPDSDKPWEAVPMTFEKKKIGKD